MTDRNEPVLDPDVIEGLRSLESDGEPGLLVELVDLFLSDTPPRMRNLEVALKSGDARTVEEIAHSLKSSCGNLGAASLSALFREIEALGRGRQLDSVPSLVAKSNAEFRRVEDALRSELI